MDWMNGMTRSVNLSMEAGVLVSGVVYGTGGAIRFNQLVVAFNFIAVTFLSLLLDVVSVVILHSVLELVFGIPNDKEFHHGRPLRSASFCLLSDQRSDYLSTKGGYGSVLLNKARQIEACSFSETLEFPLVLGRDFSGRVVAKGLGVGDNMNIGDEVWGALPPHQQGCHAQYVRVNKTLVCKKPHNVSLVQAGSVPYAAMTAWSALKVTGDLCFSTPKGKRVLILGGSGGVGAAAIQLLKAWGAQVVATCRADAVPLLESFGADSVVDYTHPDAEKQIREEGKYNVILDAAGLGADAGLKYADCLKDWNLSKFITLRSPMLRNLDDYGVVGGMVKNTVDLLVTNVKTGLTSKSSTIRWGFFLPLSDAIKEITTLVENGKMCPVIEMVCPFSDLPKAYERMKAGHLRGKIVINMDNE